MTYFDYRNYHRLWSHLFSSPVTPTAKALWGNLHERAENRCNSNLPPISANVLQYCCLQYWAPLFYDRGLHSLWQFKHHLNTSTSTTAYCLHQIAPDKPPLLLHFSVFSSTFGQIYHISWSSFSSVSLLAVNGIPNWKFSSTHRSRDWYCSFKPWPRVC